MWVALAGMVQTRLYSTKKNRISSHTGNMHSVLVQSTTCVHVHTCTIVSMYTHSNDVVGLP